MCEVNRGQGGVSNYGETDCEEADMCLCLLVQKKEKKRKERGCGHVQKHNRTETCQRTEWGRMLKNQLISCGSVSMRADVYNTRPHGRTERADRRAV